MSARAPRRVASASTPVGTVVLAMRGGVLQRGTIVARDAARDGSPRLRVVFYGGEIGTYSGRGISDFMLIDE